MEWYMYWLWAIGLLTLLGSMATIASVGKRKEPVSGPTAAIIVAINVVTVIALWNVLT